MSQKEVIRILEKYIEKLKVGGIPIEMAILFGSYARGEADDNSDIDVLLISSFFESGEIANKLLAWSFVREVDLRIEPLTIGTERFNQDEISPVIAMAKREGILVSC